MNKQFYQEYKRFKRGSIINVLIVFILLFIIIGICSGQQSINVQSRWEWDFCMSNQNHFIDNSIYDYETTYPIPLYRIETKIIGHRYEKIDSGDGYYILKYNIYESKIIFLDNNLREIKNE